MFYIGSSYSRTVSIFTLNKINFVSFFQPIHGAEVPVTGFSCVGKVIGGYYADIQTNCQMFHVCTVGENGKPTACEIHLHLKITFLHQLAKLLKCTTFFHVLIVNCCHKISKLVQLKSLVRMRII